MLGMSASSAASTSCSLTKCLAEGLQNAYVNAALQLGKNAGGFEHRMNCAFAAWAHVGLVASWIAETDRPLAEALPLFQELQAGLSATATKLLTE